MKTLFIDIGGVLLTNGWDRKLRTKAAQVFNLDSEELNARHQLTYDTYEVGKITLDVYLERIVFYEPRSFSKEEFKSFIFNQAKAFTDMIGLISQLRQQYALKVVTLSNEGRELMEDRIIRFKMKDYIDFFICSSFIQMRKPDLAMYRLALDLAQVKPQDAIYVDDRSMLVEVGKQLGMCAIHHVSFEQTQTALITALEQKSLIKGKI